MASIILKQNLLLGGVPYLTGATVSVSASLALQLVPAQARWTAAATVRNLPTEPGLVVFIEEITALTGDAPAGLNGYLVSGVPVGRMFDVAIPSLGNLLRRYLVIAKDGEVPDGDSIIEPPDFDSSGNNKYLLRIA